jgi:hypothetical protein
VDHPEMKLGASTQWPGLTLRAHLDGVTKDEERSSRTCAILNFGENQSVVMSKFDASGHISLGNALYAGAVAEVALLAMITKGALTRQEAQAAIDVIQSALEAGRGDYPLGPTPVDYATGRLRSLRKRIG